MEILPYVEGWQPGAPVCTAEQFDGIMAAAGKAAALPGFGHTAYFLAQSATDPAEKGRRWQAILSARMKYSTADHDPEMEQAIAKDHNAILSITAGEMRQDALEEMRAIVPQTAEGTPAGPILKPLSRVEPGKAQYLLHPYLPQGMLSIMGGVSGVGKTWLVLSWAAAITRGARLPFRAIAGVSSRKGLRVYHDSPKKQHLDDCIQLQKTLCDMMSTASAEVGHASRGYAEMVIIQIDLVFPAQ